MNEVVFACGYLTKAEAEMALEQFRWQHDQKNWGRKKPREPFYTELKDAHVERVDKPNLAFSLTGYYDPSGWLEDKFKRRMECELNLKKGDLLPNWGIIIG